MPFRPDDECGGVVGRVFFFLMDGNRLPTGCVRAGAEPEGGQNAKS